MSDQINAVILAAGKGTRLKIETAKPLCPAGGKTLIDYVLAGLEGFSFKLGKAISYNMVVGYEKEKVKTYVQESYPKLDFSFAAQEQQLGTGHAVKTFFDAYPDAWKNEYTLVVCADTPLITPEAYQQLWEGLKETDADAICASFHAKFPRGYGRIERHEDGFNIIEEKDASEEQKKISEVNSGLYIFRTKHIKNHIESLDDKNESGEFYLTDLFKKGYNVSPLVFKDDRIFMGINNLVQLEEVEALILKRNKKKLMLSGVRFINASTSYIEPSVEIGAESVIYPHVTIMGTTKIGKNVTIEPGAVIKDSVLEDNVMVKAYSYFEKAHIKNEAAVGPFARLREGTVISEHCKVGNFVETKKSILHAGVKVSHLSYVGDAEIGENTNIGCGFITCNYDGANKHKTEIGKDCFIGSDCQMIAPVKLGNEVYVGSGSTINQDVPDGAFAIARQRQTNKEGMAKKFIKKK